jgi:PAS domain S-box-containing protein
VSGAQRHIRQLLGWLGDREHQLQLALEAADLGTWHWNLKTGETFWSERCRTLLGVGPDTPASFERLLELVHADDRPGLMRVVEEACRSGATCSKEYRVSDPDGTVRWLHSIGRVQRARGPGGAPIMSGVIQDVTDARMANAAAERLRALESRERLWSSAFVHNTHGLAVSDAAALAYLAVNPAYVRLLGFTCEELEGSGVQERYPAGEHERVRALSERADELGAASMETLQLHRDGTPIPVLLDLVSVRDAQGRLSYRISTITDLRERRHAEAELRRREARHLIDQRFRLLAESAPIGILLTDATGVITYANPAWLAITGRTAEQALAHHAIEIIHPDDRERLRAAWREAARRDSLDLEFRTLRPGGEARWMRSHASAMRDVATAEVLGYVHTSVDITDSLQERAARERTHVQVRSLAHRLEHLRALERAELADTLKKDFYEHLTALKNGLALLQAGSLAAPTDPAMAPGAMHTAALAQLLGQAEAAQERLRHIVFDLRPPGIEELGFAPAIDRFASELGAQWALRIDLDIPAAPLDVPQHVLGVLYDVAREALGNVARHARATRASLGVAISGGGISLRVSDNGCGMGEQDRHKPGCYGLLRAAERLAGLGGSLRTLGLAGSGTLLQASVPLASADRR